jgi:hypothetical protein
LRIGVFTSAGFSTALATPQVQIVSEGWAAAALSSHAVRLEKERCLVAAYSSRFTCVSASAREQLLTRFPKIEPARVLALYGEQEPVRLWLSLCDAWRRCADLNDLNIPFHRDWTRLRGLQAEVDVGVD